MKMNTKELEMEFFEWIERMEIPEYIPLSKKAFELIMDYKSLEHEKDEELEELHSLYRDLRFKHTKTDALIRMYLNLSQVANDYNEYEEAQDESDRFDINAVELQEEYSLISNELALVSKQVISAHEKRGYTA